MAYKEIELTEEERAAAGAKFFKFGAIGDKLVGRFIRTQPTTGTYAKAGQLDYVFRTKAGDVSLSPPADAALKLKKANLKPGNAVMISYERDQDVGKESLMKVFRVLVDDSPAVAKKPEPAPPPVPDDIDF